jgi:hypothetical protein
VTHYIVDNLPSETGIIESELLVRGLATGHFGLRGIISALRLLGRKVPFAIASCLDKQFLVHPDGGGVPKLAVSLAVKAVNKFGIANVADICAQVGEKAKHALPPNSVASILSLRADFGWVDRGKGWFWFASISRNRLRGVIRKILSVGNRVDVSELRAGISRCDRMDGFAPPRDILLQFCRQFPWCRVDGRRVWADPPIDWNSELKRATNEWAMCAVLKEGTPLKTVDKLEEECLSLGMNKHSFVLYLSRSPIILRYAPRIYGLVGTDVAPGTIESLLSGDMHTKASADYGWTKKNEIWLVRKISRGTLKFGSVYLPSSLRRFVDGEYALKSADAVPFGKITTKDSQVWGIRSFLIRRGAEPGDYIGLIFNLSSRDVKAYLGNEELLSEFVPDQPSQKPVANHFNS